MPITTDVSQPQIPTTNPPSSTMTDSNNQESPHLSTTREPYTHGTEPNPSRTNTMTTISQLGITKPNPKFNLHIDTQKLKHPTLETMKSRTIT